MPLGNPIATMDLDPQLRPGGGPTRDRISSIALGGIGGSPATSSPSSADAGGPVGGCHSVPPSTTISLNAASDLPNRPLSAADSSANAHSQQLDATATTGEQQAPDGTDPKRSRACEACRGLKVRCDPGPNDEQAPCKRCRKAGRRCVVTAPSRKRQKKTDSRVSELEKKIDALTASLQARGATGVSPELGHGVGGMGGVAHSAGTSPGGGDGEAVTVSPTAISARHRSSIDEPRGKGRSRGNMGSMGPPETTSVLSTPTGRDQPPAFQPPMVMAGMKRKASDKGSTMGEERKCSPQHASSPWTRPDQGDIVDRGIISMDQAADLFARYTDRMAPHLPAVIFPPSMTASELRRSKPILFLAVMAAAGSEIHTLQMTLQRELMTVFAEKVFLSGDKSLEIVQALLVAVIWYWPPEHFEELKFYQLVHVAAVMAIDIGLGKKAPPRRTGPNQFNWQTHPFRRHGPPDPTTIESRRTWLGCYFLTCNTSIALHRPYLVRWTSFMSESIDILELSPDAAPTDQYFCHLVQQHHLGEDIGGQFSLDDAANVVDINDARTQYALKALERDLDKFRSAVPEDLMRRR